MVRCSLGSVLWDDFDPAGRVEIPVISSTIIVWPVPARGSYGIDREVATRSGMETRRGYLRILHLERLEVEYKSVKSLTTREGTFHHVSKKDFCRLLKTAHLMTSEEIQKSWYH